MFFKRSVTEPIKYDVLPVDDERAMKARFHTCYLPLSLPRLCVQGSDKNNKERIHADQVTLRSDVNYLFRS